MFVFLILAFTLSASASIYSQNQRVSFEFKEASILDVLNEIKLQTDLHFVYNEDKIDELRAINLEASNIRVDEVLEEIFKDTNLECRFQNDVIMIVDRKPVPPVKEKQEEKEIKGTVTDEKGVPLPGVSVFIKGSTTGAATDIDGNYSLDIGQENAVLVFSFVGMQTQEIAYTGQVVLNVTLEEDASNLEEVVVTGYQTISKERATGSFVQLSEDDFEQRITTDFKSKLEGMVSGLYVDGETQEITIRGTGTVYGDSKPLIVVDGFPVEADLSTINPDDIKSVTVLKDAAAASIWGVKAANGVIVVTTKMGRRNSKVNINASYYLTVEEKPNFENMKFASSDVMVDLELDLIDAGQWDPASYATTIYRANEVQNAYWLKWKGEQSMEGGISTSEYDALIEKLKNTNRYNQIEEYLLRSSLSHQLNVSMNGGGDKSSFFTSLAYNSNRFSSVGNSNDRVNINIRNEYDLSSRFKLSASANLTYNKGTSNGIPLNNFMWDDVYEALVDDEGNPAQYYVVNPAFGKEREGLGYLSYTTNDIDIMNQNDNTSNGFDARIQIGLNYNIGKGFNFDTKFQYERGYAKTRNYRETSHPETRQRINTYTLVDDYAGELIYQVPKGGWLMESKNDHEAWTWRNQLNYDKNWNDDKHQLSAIAGQEVRKYVTYTFSDEKMGYDPQTLKYTPMDESAWLSRMQDNAWYGPTGMVYNPFTNRAEYDNRDISFYMNASYTLNRKYTLTASARIDQSNLFGNDSEYKYNPLWSAGLSWKISDENFMQKLDWVDQLTIRATYGMSGNTNKNFYPTPMGISGVSYTTGIPYITLSNPENKKLKWETAKMINIGTDFSLFNNRIWGSIEYYKKASRDIIGRQTLDATNGWSAANTNFASINNYGYEVALNATPVKNKDFSWESNLNISHNKNKVVDVGIDGATTQNYMSTISSMEELNLYAQYNLLGFVGIPIAGKPISRVYAYKYAGLDDNGQPLIYNENDELVSWINFDGNKDALKYMGSSIPTFFGNFRNRFSYKGLSLALNFTYKFGHVFRAPKATVSTVSIGAYNNLADRWKKPGDETTKNVPGINNYYQYSMDEFYKYGDLNVLSGDLIRLSDLSVDYDLPKKLINKTPFTDINIIAQVRNLWLWTANDQDYDPDAVASEFGMERFPAAKTFVFGIKANF